MLNYLYINSLFLKISIHSHFIFTDFVNTISLFSLLSKIFILTPYKLSFKTSMIHKDMVHYSSFLISSLSIHSLLLYWYFFILEHASARNTLGWNTGNWGHHAVPTAAFPVLSSLFLNLLFIASYNSLTPHLSLHLLMNLYTLFVFLLFLSPFATFLNSVYILPVFVLFPLFLIF